MPKLLGMEGGCKALLFIAHLVIVGGFEVTERENESFKLLKVFRVQESWEGSVPALWLWVQSSQELKPQFSKLWDTTPLAISKEGEAGTSVWRGLVDKVRKLLVHKSSKNTPATIQENDTGTKTMKYSSELDDEFPHSSEEVPTTRRASMPTRKPKGKGKQKGIMRPEEEWRSTLSSRGEEILQELIYIFKVTGTTMTIKQVTDTIMPIKQVTDTTMPIEHTMEVGTNTFSENEYSMRIKYLLDTNNHYYLETTMKEQPHKSTVIATLAPFPQKPTSKTFTYFGESVTVVNCMLPHEAKLEVNLTSGTASSSAASSYVNTYQSIIPTTLRAKYSSSTEQPLKYTTTSCSSNKSFLPCTLLPPVPSPTRPHSTNSPWIKLIFPPSSTTSCSINPILPCPAKTAWDRTQVSSTTMRSITVSARTPKLSENGGWYTFLIHPRSTTAPPY